MSKAANHQNNVNLKTKKGNDAAISGLPLRDLMQSFKEFKREERKRIAENHLKSENANTDFSQLVLH